jgi:hypothetical protein
MVRMECRQRPTAPSSNDRPSPSSVAHLPVQGCHRLTMTSTYPGSVRRTRACLAVRWQAIHVEPAKMSALVIDKARVSKTDLPDADRYLVNPGLAVSASVARIRYQASGLPELCRR